MGGDYRRMMGRESYALRSTRTAGFVRSDQRMPLNN
jgi:hypothetical protein